MLIFIDCCQGAEHFLSYGSQLHDCQHPHPSAVCTRPSPGLQRIQGRSFMLYLVIVAWMIDEDFLLWFRVIIHNTVKTVSQVNTGKGSLHAVICAKYCNIWNYSWVLPRAFLNVSHGSDVLTSERKLFNHSFSSPFRMCRWVWWNRPRPLPSKRQVPIRALSSPVSWLPSTQSPRWWGRVSFWPSENVSQLLDTSIIYLQLDVFVRWMPDVILCHTWAVCLKG